MLILTRRTVETVMVGTEVTIAGQLMAIGARLRSQRGPASSSPIGT